MSKSVPPKPSKPTEPSRPVHKPAPKPDYPKPQAPSHDPSRREKPLSTPPKGDPPGL